MNASTSSPPRWLLLLVLAAVVVGVVVRFTGLGYAPFAVDEYYLSRSVDSVLRGGLPAFDCGGYYTRGLILQYLIAGLRSLGMSAELAPRALSAVFSLAALPAAYLLGRRAHGRVVGVLVVLLLAVSTWEVEMARFGRMYAPFQAVFLWYLVFFLRYTVDREVKALWAMLALSIAGPFVWEGGVFLLLLNLLPPFLAGEPGRIDVRRWPYLLATGALLLIGVWFVSFGFRGDRVTSLPGNFDASAGAPLDPLSTLRIPLTQLSHHPAWLIAALIVLIPALLALRWIWSLRARPLLAGALLVALIAAMAHQFLLGAALLVLLMLTRYATPDDFRRPAARAFWIAIAACLVFWVAYGLGTLDWSNPSAGSHARALAMLGYQLLAFPDVIGVIARPWAWAVPHLGALLLLLYVPAFLRALREPEPLSASRVLLIVFTVMILAASASHPPRQETRYVFDLYPLAIIIALGVLARFVARVADSPRAVAAGTTALALGGFMLSEDFQPRHLRHVDSPAETFRVGMSEAMQSHLVVRHDFRALAGWLQTNVPASGIVINSVHGLDKYYGHFRYFYAETGNRSFADWSCRHGTVDRWSNDPLLYGAESLAAAVGPGAKAYLVTFGYDNEATLQSLAALHPKIVATEGTIIIIELKT
jgi:hypothetical protein